MRSRPAMLCDTATPTPTSWTGTGAGRSVNGSVKMRLFGEQWTNGGTAPEAPARGSPIPAGKQYPGCSPSGVGLPAEHIAG